MVHYKGHASAVNHAYCGSDDEFIDAMSAFERAMPKKIEDLPFTHKAELGSLLTLKRLYCVRREKTNYYEQKYNTAHMEYNSRLFKFDENLSTTHHDTDVEF